MGGALATAGVGLAHRVGEAGKDLAFLRIIWRTKAETSFSMQNPHTNPTQPCAMPPWDISFTRLALAMRPWFEACTFVLERRLQTIGLGIDTQVRQTPRGLSTYLSLLGERGLICIVDMTLVDGMAVNHGPCAALEIRLLDACGDVVVDGLADGLPGSTGLESSTALALMSGNPERAATAVYVAALGHFDLLRPAARYG
jgi:hypothetical protein